MFPVAISQKTCAGVDFEPHGVSFVVVFVFVVSDIVVSLVIVVLVKAVENVQIVDLAVVDLADFVVVVGTTTIHRYPLIPILMLMLMMLMKVVLASSMTTMTTTTTTAVGSVLHRVQLPPHLFFLFLLPFAYDYIVCC